LPPRSSSRPRNFSSLPIPRRWFIASGTTPTTYDDGGNITQDTKFRSYKYEYDANNRQTGVKLADNTSVEGAVYDAGGLRVQTSASGVTRTMVYDVMGQDVADYNGSSLERENIYRGGQLLATQPIHNRTGECGPLVRKRERERYLQLGRQLSG